MTQITRAARAPVTHGQNIFIYGHVRTNQVIYSLTRAIDNKSALKQLPYLGKKTKPAVIRKDFWKPIAVVRFPSVDQGLSAYRQLREFRKRHEHEWDFEPVRYEKRRIVARNLRDQRANSIADLAAVLEGQERVAQIHTERDLQFRKRIDDARDFARQRMPILLESMRRLRLKSDTNAKLEYKKMKAEKIRLRRATRSQSDSELIAAIDRIQRSTRSNEPDFTGVGKFVSQSPLSFSAHEVRITWANILDAEHASTWPKAVMHASLDRKRGSPRHTYPGVKSQASNVSEDLALESKTPSLVTAAVQRNTTRVQIKTLPSVSFLDRLAHRLKFGRV